MESRRNNTLSILSLILGIVGLIGIFIIIGIVPCLAALILGIIALTHKQHTGMAVGGIVTSIIGILFFFIILFSASDSSETVERSYSANNTAEQSSIHADTLADRIDTTLYYLEQLNDTYAFVIAENNSDTTVNIDANLSAKDTAGDTISTYSSSISALAPGESYPLWNYFENISAESIADIDYTITVTKSSETSVVDHMNCSVENTTAESVIVKATNKSNEDIYFPEAFAIFFKDQKPVAFGNTYLDNVSSDCILQSGKTVIKSIDCFSDNSFDDVKVYYHATK